ncbi:MFS general substrate transporter [Astrocystis sublimbata]|nr:MFS general substrate transporter [Astrocystis sublimbata]
MHMHMRDLASPETLQEDSARNMHLRDAASSETLQGDFGSSARSTHMRDPASSETLQEDFDSSARSTHKRDPASSKNLKEDFGGSAQSTHTRDPESANNPQEDFSNAGDGEKANGAPDGGAKAWGVVAGGLINYIATFGLLNSFGTFQTYYENELLPHESASTISWIGSIQLFLLFATGIVLGPAFDKFGAIRMTIPGTFLYILSLELTSLGKEYYQIFLAQGILFGIADAMLFYPTISAINMWFDRKRGLALGIVVAGSSIGDIIWPILIHYLFGKIGFGWTVRAVGFICLGLLIVSVFLVVERHDEKKPGNVTTDKKNLKQELKSPAYISLTSGFTLAYLGLFVPFYYLPSYGLAHDLDPTTANNLLAFLNAGSFVGRIISGYLADTVGAFNVAIITSLLSSVTVFSLIAITTEPSIIAFSVLYGLFSGGLISLQSVCLARLTSDMGTYGTKIGILMAVNSIG